MARLRSIKPEYWHDRKLARQTSRDARLLYIGLWNHSDEWARSNGDPAVIKGQVFPYDPVDVEPLLSELVAAGVVVRYEVDGDPFLFLPKLAKHQRLEPNKVASRFPSPDDADPPGNPAPRADLPAHDQGLPPDKPSDLHTQILSDRSEKNGAESGKKVALHVAGGIEQVAGSREQDGAELPRRDDIEQVCELLRQRMIQNGCKEPVVTKAWRDAARLLLDRDQRPLNEVLYVLDWSQRDDFWAKNVHSLPTFREKYDRLRMGAQQQSQRGSPQSNADGFRALIQKFEAQRIGGAQ